MTITWSKSYLRQAFTFSIGSLVTGTVLGISSHHLFGSSPLGLWMTYGMIGCGILFALFPLPIYWRRHLALSANDERIEIKSPHTAIGRSVEVRTSEVNQLTYRKGFESEAIPILLLNSGVEIDLPTEPDFPTGQLAILIQSRKRHSNG